MCGRFLLATPTAELGRLFGIDGPGLNLPARFNIAPTQDVAVIRMRAEGGRELVALRWGLVPSWADDPAIGSRMINARSETAAEKPSFRSAFKSRRCLIPADGFYEWAPPATPKGRKRPHLIRRRDRRPFVFAALWERWNGPKGQPPLDRPLDTVTILTTSASPDVVRLHDRMPVVLDAAAAGAWLDPGTPPAEAAALLLPTVEGVLDAVPVSARVNAVKHDDAGLIEPEEETEGARLL